MPSTAQPQLRGAILENLLELLPVGVRIIDEQGTTIYANPAARQIWNGEQYVPAERWKAFKAWRAADNSPLDPGELAGARALRTGETVLREELEIEAFDGARKVILKSAIPIADEAGARCGAVTVNEDITELKRIQQRLSETNEALLTALAAARMISWKWDPATDTLEYIGNVAEFYGMESPEEAGTGRGSMRRVHPEDAEALQAGIQAARETGQPYRHAFRLFHARLGEYRWYEVQGRPQRDPRSGAVYLTGVTVDIHERKLIEEREARVQQSLDAALQATRTVAWMVDLGSGAVTFSRNVSQMIGLPPSPAPGEVEEAMRGMPEDDRERQVRLFRHAQEECSSYTNEYCWVDPRTGEPHYYREHGKAEAGPDGRAVRMHGVTQEITQTRRLEEALQLSFDRLTNALDAIPDAFAILDPEGRYRFANGALVRALGRTREELLGAKAGELWPEPLAPVHARLFGQALELRTGVSEEVYVTVEGQTRVYDLAYIPLAASGGAVREVIAAGRDVTRLKQAAEDLALANQRFEVALHHAPVHVFTQDCNLVYTWVNKLSPGMTPGDIIGKTDYDLFPRPAAEQLTELKRRALASDAPIEEEVCLPYEGRRETYHRVTLQPLKGLQGETLGLAGASLDITEQVRKRNALEMMLRRGTDPLVVITGAGLIREVSVRGAQLLGASPEELRGADAVQLVHPADRLTLRLLLADARTQQLPEVTASFRVRQGSGDYVWMNARADLRLSGTQEEEAYAVRLELIPVRTGA